MSFNERIQEAKKLVGQPYEMFFEGEDKYYKGCFAPVYFAYPNLPKYPLPGADPENNFDYGMVKILKSAYPIDKKDIQAGDVLVTKYKNELHVGLMVDKFRLMHVFRNHTMQIDRLTFFKKEKIKFYRVKSEKL
jgi:hypothetical protein